MAEVINGITYESLWHSSESYKLASNEQKKIIATSLEVIYRKEYGESPPYINKKEGVEHGFPQGYLGYSRNFLSVHIEQFFRK